MGKACHSLARLFHQEKGSAAVEMAIVVPVFTILLFGIVDFGHAWYMRHVMSYASREAARYGTRLVSDTVSGKPKLPSQLNPSIDAYIKNPTSSGGWGLSNSLPADAAPTVTPSGAAWTETNPANLGQKDLTVTITATKKWFIASALIPSLGATKTITVNATMKHE